MAGDSDKDGESRRTPDMAPLNAIESPGASESLEAAEPLEATEPLEASVPLEANEPLEATEPPEAAEPLEAAEPMETTGGPSLPPPPPPVAPRGPQPQRIWINLSLFALSFCSAMVAEVLPNLGARSLSEAVQVLLAQPATLLDGLPFAVALMAILVAHEAGHFIAARRYGVNQSLPYFIPAPTIFGTLGALILMRGQPRDRRMLLNVAVAGPYAGLLVALPLTAWGLSRSLPLETVGPHVIYGQSVLFGWLNAIFGPGTDQLALHPIALAGWVGLFITAINLIPAAQLDGGHIAYSLVGHWQERLATIVVVLLFVLGVVLGLDPGVGLQRGLLWVFWAVFLFVVGVRHPPVRNEAVSPTRLQRVHGVAALTILALTFTPIPFELVGQEDLVSPDQRLLPFEPLDNERFEDDGGAPAEEFEL